MCYWSAVIPACKQPVGCGLSYLSIAQFHTEVNLSVPLGPVDVRREELHSHCVFPGVYVP